MIALTLDRIAEITQTAIGGSARPDAVVDGPVVIDSRQAAPRALFAALGGEHVDGHDFAASAVEAGAVAALVSRPVDAPHLLAQGGDDGVVEALARLARYTALELSDPRRGAERTEIVAVTGSSGKTTTKDLIAQVVGRAGPTIAPAGSFNNEIGHPLTVLRADTGTRHLVLEVAARGIGHIAHLCRVAPPRIGVVLNVGSAHMGEFGDRDTIAKAKGELVESLPPGSDGRGSGGVAVLNADDPRVNAMASRTRARVVTYGLAEEAHVRATDVVLGDSGAPSFTLHLGGRQARVDLSLVGAHQVSNALAAAAVADELGMDVADVAEALAAATPASRWRMEVTEHEGATLVNDAYNANPESMRAALATLGALARDRRSIAVLAHMAELGEDGHVEHERIGELAARTGVAHLIVVGEAAEGIASGAESAARQGLWQGESVRVADAPEAAAALRERLRTGDVVIVKGSRVAALEKVIDIITEGDVQ
ncbi:MULTISPECIES: UDP-N-acetylmuramoyl-tripeptide--D-alanyl-D-alanine ligase [Nocardiopsis]|uniref:UDP-N-acetylmuramoyl-tripeptide--D-alanyl-D-alanine ligase n=1 Tax=Nocardiopsis sinuspersici TaxID=501010 RepID=A0A1V3BXP3_9ACTN|nr:MULTISPECIES: UDP-N-acetylmuramoyl-tripeptide--D-alanyl-D-alanine ligase [Nocardiopsis]OOC53152.1 UDP-N-acetylmuramoyl-tripeptide--D-alanyl-D-alanine ligase [Nocardiopsis sinuspersici]